MAIFLEIGNWDGTLEIKPKLIMPANDYKNLCFVVLQLVHNVEACSSVRPDLYTRPYNWGDSEALPQRIGTLVG